MLACVAKICTNEKAKSPPSKANTPIIGPTKCPTHTNWFLEVTVPGSGLYFVVHHHSVFGPGPDGLADFYVGGVGLVGGQGLFRFKLAVENEVVG